jgi:hypothetical protein
VKLGEDVVVDTCLAARCDASSATAPPTSLPSSPTSNAGRPGACHLVGRSLLHRFNLAIHQR